MCDLSEKLIAWLDCELPENEADDVERHVLACAECRSCFEAYKKINKGIEAYCDAAIGSRAHRGLSPPWAPVLAAAAAVALLLLFPSGHVDRRPSQGSVGVASSASVLQAPLEEETPAPITKPVHRRRVVASAQSQNANWMPMEPAIQIAIPAEAMFAPGAVPQGLSLTAELSIAADGSAQQLRLHP